MGGSESYEILPQRWIHPDYDGTTGSEDIGLLDIDGQVPVGLDLLPREMVDELSVGQPAGRSGTPENLALRSVMATCMPSLPSKTGSSVPSA